MANHRDLAGRAFDEVCSRFPALRHRRDDRPEHVEMELSFPAQPDLLFDVHLNLQNEDELHLNASLLWVSWFPCSDEIVWEAFVDAAAGLISGDYRIVEHRRGARTVRAELQRPVGGGWETLTGNSYLSIPWPRKIREIVQNPRFEARGPKTGRKR